LECSGRVPPEGHLPPETEPSKLSEGDIAYLSEVLDESESKWVTWKYVESQSEYYDKALAQIPEFTNPTPDNQPSPSFEQNMRARVSEADTSDKVLLDLYAQIRAGERRKPGSFSKRTCNLVGQLTPEAIAIFEAHASTRFANFIPATAQFGDILILEEHGLATSSRGTANFDSHAGGVRLPGGKAVVWTEGAPFQIIGYKLSNSAVELLKLHFCESSEDTQKWIIAQVPSDRNPQVHITD
jgi:hypothetical protein